MTKGISELGMKQKCVPLRITKITALWYTNPPRVPEAEIFFTEHFNLQLETLSPNK